MPVPSGVACNEITIILQFTMYDVTNIHCIINTLIYAIRLLLPTWCILAHANYLGSK